MATHKQNSPLQQARKGQNSASAWHNGNNKGKGKGLATQPITNPQCSKEHNNDLCFNCRKPGHFSRNCKAPQKGTKHANKGKGKAKAAAKKPQEGNDSFDKQPPQYQKSGKAKASIFVSHPDENDSDMDMSYYLAIPLPDKGSPEPQRGRTATIQPLRVQLAMSPSPQTSGPSQTSVAESTSDSQDVTHIPHREEREMHALKLHISHK